MVIIIVMQEIDLKIIRVKREKMKILLTQVDEVVVLKVLREILSILRLPVLDTILDPIVERRVVIGGTSVVRTDGDRMVLVVVVGSLLGIQTD